MNLPGSAKAHVWTGLLVALAGVLVGGYAYTGDRVYDVVYLPVALLGLALLVAGSSLAGYGQANRPRLGGHPDADDEESPLRERARAALAGLLDSGEDQEDDEDEEDEGAPEAGSEPDETPPETGLVERTLAVLPALGEAEEDAPGDGDAREAQPDRSAGGPERAEPVEADLECPSCRTSFTATGTPPLDVACPNCEHRAEVDPRPPDE